MNEDINEENKNESQLIHRITVSSDTKQLLA